MTTVVAFPSMDETFKRALDEVLRSFFDGAAHSVGGVSVTFPLVDLVYTVRRFRGSITKPVIAILAGGIASQREEKCSDPTGEVSHAYEKRATVNCQIFVRAPTSLSKEDGDLLAVQVYDKLHSVIVTQTALLSARNIHLAVMAPTSTQIEDEQDSIVSGTLTCEIRAIFTRR